MAIKRRTKQVIKKSIISYAKSEYKRIGLKPARVTVSFVEDEISIFINPEKPYLGEKIWDFIKNLIDNLKDELKTKGYVYSNTIQCFDCCAIVYEKIKK